MKGREEEEEEGSSWEVGDGGRSRKCKLEIRQEENYNV